MIDNARTNVAAMVGARSTGKFVSVYASSWYVSPMNLTVNEYRFHLGRAEITRDQTYLVGNMYNTITLYSSTTIAAGPIHL